MSTEQKTAVERMEADVMRDIRGRSQRFFVHKVCNDLLDGVRAYPRTPGELPEHDVVMTSDGPDAMLERFKREPDMLAGFLPEGFAVVDTAYLTKILDMLAGAAPISVLGGAMHGKDYAEMALRFSADRLYGVSEMARRQHADESDH